jgi:hypothetical protein
VILFACLIHEGSCSQSTFWFLSFFSVNSPIHKVSRPPSCSYQFQVVINEQHSTKITVTCTDIQLKISLSLKETVYPFWESQKQYLWHLLTITIEHDYATLYLYIHLGMSQNLGTLVNPKLPGKWMFIPPNIARLVLIHPHLLWGNIHYSVQFPCTSNVPFASRLEWCR